MGLTFSFYNIILILIITFYMDNVDTIVVLFYKCMIILISERLRAENKVKWASCLDIR